VQGTAEKLPLPAQQRIEENIRDVNRHQAQQDLKGTYDLVDMGFS
jgi:hypothetical protein